MTRLAGMAGFITRSISANEEDYDARAWELAYKPNLTGTR